MKRTEGDDQTRVYKQLTKFTYTLETNEMNGREI